MTAGLEKTIVDKTGVKVMLKRKIDISLGLVNGTIGLVDKVECEILHAQVSTMNLKLSIELSFTKNSFQSVSCLLSPYIKVKG